MTQALHTLHDHAERLRDEARAHLQRAEDAVARLQLQADHLQTYRDQTQQRSPLRGGGSAPIDVWRGHLVFLERLDLALNQQRAHLRAEQARRDALRAALLACETRVASVRKLIERRDAEARRHADRQDQRRSDDAAQRQHATGRAARTAWNSGAESAASTY